MNAVSVPPRGAIPSIDDSTFGDEYGGEPDDGGFVVDAGPK